MSSFIKELVQLHEDKVIELTKERLEKGEDPLDIIDDVKAAMSEVGDKYEKKEYFMPELIMSGEILEQVFNLVEPKLDEDQIEEKEGTVLLGTVEGDIHNIGKDLVNFMLDVNGYEVIDIGEDKKPEEFVEEIKKNNPDVVGLSGLLTLSYDSMRKTVDSINEAEIKDSIKIMIGGSTIDESTVEYSGADAYGKSAVDAVNLAQKWVGGN